MRTRAVFPFTAIVGQESIKVALLLNAISPVIGGVLIRGHKGTAKSTAVRALPREMPIEASGALSIRCAITRLPPLSRMVMTSAQLFLTASASAAAMTFLAVSKLIGGP